MKCDYVWEDYSSQEQKQEGLYVAAFFTSESTKMISDFLRKHNVPDPVPEASLHTTIVYSKAPVENFEVNHTLDIEVKPEYSRIECWDTPSGKTLVWALFCPYLELRFQEAMVMGATYDYDEYKPHITLCYDVKDFDCSHIPTPDFSVVIAGEYSEPLMDTMV